MRGAPVLDLHNPSPVARLAPRRKLLVQTLMLPCALSTARAGAELRLRFSTTAGVVAAMVGVQPRVLDRESCTRSHRRVVV